MWEVSKKALEESLRVCDKLTSTLVSVDRTSHSLHAAEKVVLVLPCV